MVMAMENTKRQDHLQAVWFAAGVAALMACLERAMLVSFVEQWRVIAFLALNLLLLAILFTSRTPTLTFETSSESISNTTESKVEKRSVKECKKPLVPSVDEVSATKDVKEQCTLDNRENREEPLGNVGEVDYTIDDTHQISMEELNERAEAFIAMFRQHLISDAKAYSYSKSCRIRTPITIKGGDKIFAKRRPIY